MCRVMTIFSVKAVGDAQDIIPKPLSFDSFMFCSFVESDLAGSL